MRKQNYIIWIQKFYCLRKVNDIYKGIAKDVEARFDTSNYELERLLPTEKNKRGIGLMKDELGEKIVKEFVGLRAKCVVILRMIMMKIKKQVNKKVCQKRKT